MPTPPFQLEPGHDGRRAVLTSEWNADVSTAIRELDVAELELNIGKGWQGDNIDFLSEIPHLRSLTILDLNIRSIEPIHQLRELQRLSVTTYCDTPIDFSVFPNLEEVSLEWRPGCDTLFERTALTALFVNKYLGPDCEPFGHLVNLNGLALLGASFTTLHGLQPLTKLRSLRLGLLHRLTSLAGIEHLASLECLDINACKKIESIDELAHLHRLRILGLNNCGKLKSLRPIAALERLEDISFYGTTNIIDGDLSPLVNKHQAKPTAFQNRSHYSHKREQLWEQSEA